LFFTADDRPFCLYVVIAGRVHVRAIVTELNELLQQLDLAS